MHGYQPERTTQLGGATTSHTLSLRVSSFDHLRPQYRMELTGLERVSNGTTLDQSWSAELQKSEIKGTGITDHIYPTTNQPDHAQHRSVLAYPDLTTTTEYALPAAQALSRLHLHSSDQITHSDQLRAFSSAYSLQNNMHYLDQHAPQQLSSDLKADNSLDNQYGIPPLTACVPSITHQRQLTSMDQLTHRSAHVEQHLSRTCSLLLAST
ncbi:hypothetical protein F511_39622 [Dorcoceras hygrometricum]|uniref:Uncharacterized protein n=1 Tax=Dorcoceras hygrometricum TaxID=472368 RepID=A0A2Z7BA62_9LAMI|nr:hypothetical protein F511_39622 [Dorcoceras hygrometricum]